MYSIVKRYCFGNILSTLTGYINVFFFNFQCIVQELEINLYYIYISTANTSKLEVGLRGKIVKMAGVGTRTVTCVRKVQQHCVCGWGCG